ncbi:hypothetical protein A2U01_0095728 [Trifolium medium]|uniref:Uncharacterized protein n=1 Tax=Trifolium medium TaxID=97028 RepID=A0A392UP97_9FABA|nr:hypothetical protein [Trifolium medium]
MKRKKKLQLDAVLRWIHSEPIIMVLDKRSRPEKDDYGNQCCKKECGYITVDEPEKPILRNRGNASS